MQALGNPRMWLKEKRRAEWKGDWMFCQCNDYDRSGWSKRSGSGGHLFCSLHFDLRLGSLHTQQLKPAAIKTANHTEQLHPSVYKSSTHLSPTHTFTLAVRQTHIPAFTPTLPLLMASCSRLMFKAQGLACRPVISRAELWKHRLHFCGLLQTARLCLPATP